MRSFYDKEDYSIEDIQGLILNQVEESIYLDFKDARSLDKGEKKRIDISKDVASFANSDGGIIIYGLVEKDHVASELSFVDGNEFTKEWLEQVIHSSIQKRIEDIIIFPIRQNGNLTETIYVVKIPPSVNAPHISKDNRFYKRYNFLSVPLEEYEVRHLYSRRVATALMIQQVIVTPAGNATSARRLQSSRQNLAFQIENIGKSIENQYKLELHVPTEIITKHGSQNPCVKFKVRNENDYTVLSIPNDSPIYQGEITTSIRIDVEFTSFTRRYLETPIKIKLYYSNGVVEKQVNLVSKYMHEGRMIRDCEWA